MTDYVMCEECEPDEDGRCPVCGSYTISDDEYWDYNAPDESVFYGDI